jgi:hypothetical protein
VARLHGKAFKEEEFSKGGLSSLGFQDCSIALGNRSKGLSVGVEGPVGFCDW